MEKIYISGPISGLDEQVVCSAFTKVENRLKQWGFIPVSPLNNGLPKTAPYEEHMRRDLELLRECDSIYMLNGWERSQGCRIEWKEAVTLGIRITYEKENE